MMNIEFFFIKFNSKIAQQDTVLRAAPGGGGGFWRPNRFELIPVSSLVFFANVDLKTRKITSGRSVCGSMLLLWPHYTFFHFTSRALSALWGRRAHRGHTHDNDAWGPTADSLIRALSDWLTLCTNNTTIYMWNALERANKVSVAPAVTRHKMNRDSLGNFPLTLGVIISLRLMFGVVFFVIYLAAPSRISARTSKMTRRKMSIFSSQGLGFAWRQLAHYFLSSFKWRMTSFTHRICVFLVLILRALQPAAGEGGSCAPGSIRKKIEICKSWLRKVA